MPEKKAPTSEAPASGGKPPVGGRPPGEMGYGQTEAPGEYVESLRPDVDPGFRDPTDAELKEMFEQQPQMFGRKPPGGGGVEMTPELEAELMREGSYVPPGERYSLAGEPVRTPPGGKPLGAGGVRPLGRPSDDFLDDPQTAKMIDYITTNPSNREAFEYVEDLYASGKLTREQAIKEFDLVAKQKYFDDAVDTDAYPNMARPQTMYDRAKSGGGTPGVGRGRFHDNPGFIAKANREGYSIDDLQKSNEFLTGRRNRLKAEIDDLTAEIKEGKSPLIISSSNKRDRLKNQLEMVEGRGGRYYDEATNSISLDTVLRFRKQADALKIDFTPIQQAGLADFDLAVDLGNSLERAQVDDLLKPDYDKNPALSFIREGFEEIPSSPDQKNMKVMYEALSDLFDEVVADPRLFREQVYQGVSPDFAQKRMSARLDKKYNKIRDIEGPSEAEIQQMINQSRFGDPQELDMLKEDMRRMAQLEQGAQIESGRVRQSRTPGAPGASGKIPEGTSRTERKGTVRERPKKK